MEKCRYCHKESIVKVGKDAVPVCEEHYIKYLKGCRRVIDKVLELRRYYNHGDART